MKAQISRFPQELSKRYSGVYQQQGRMLTDADWNALSEIAKARLDQALADVIGKGTPAANPILRSETSGGITTHSLHWGDAYVDGIAAQLRPVPESGLGSGDPFDDQQQADFPGPPALPATDPYQLYLDVWDRSVIALEDSDLRDAGLHGADTTTRCQTMAQVKWAPAADFDPEDPAQNPPKGDARLSLSLRQAIAERDPCEPCADEIELQDRVGNYLFRVELHDVTHDATGQATRVVLTWSSENGGEAAAIGDEPPGFIDPEGAPESRWIYEFFHGAGEAGASEKHLGYFHPATLAAWAPARSSLTEGYPASPPAGFSLVRRWDGYCVLERSGANWQVATITIDGSEVLAGKDRGSRLSTSNGINDHGHVTEGATVVFNLDAIALTIDLADHPLLAGDYWLATVREATHEVGDSLLDAAAPVGIEHHYLCLARVESDVVTPLLKDDCRRHGFPRLTDLEAEDICYDNSACEMPDVSSVQDAIDHLCRERDLRWHNKHLHGWGIVCGLIVECGPDTTPQEGETEAARRLARLTSGYAITCEGDDIVLEQEQIHDIVALVEAHDAEAETPILTDGQGSLCLVLDLEAGAPTVGVEPYDPSQDTWAKALDGTLLMDFFQNCFVDLLNALRKEFAFLEGNDLAEIEAASGELISVERMKFTTTMNLLWQLVNPGNGSYIFLSHREHLILRDLYLQLRLLLQSKTFCAMFQGEDFPDYPFPGIGMTTSFGKNSHSRIKLHPDGKRLYSYGGTDNTINVYDIAAGKLIEVIEMPAAEGAEVTALAFSSDGNNLFATAQVRQQDSLFGIANIDEKHTWQTPMIVLCDLIVTELEVSPRDDGLLYAIGRGRGFFLLRPALLRDQTKPSPDPAYGFNAVGHLAIDAEAGLAYATGNSKPSVEPTTYDEIRVLNLDVPDGTTTPPAFPLTDPAGNGTQGDDGFTIMPGKLLYVVTEGATNSGNKRLLTYDLAQVQSGSGQARVQLEIENTQIAPAFHREADEVLLAMEDGYRLQRIANDGSKTTGFRVPLQIQPVDLLVDPKSGTVHALNFLSNTISSIPQAELAVDDAFLDRLAVYRNAVLLAFWSLFGGLIQYAKDCFCHHLLVKCPTCENDDKIYLACVEIRDGKVFNICNFGKRKYVKSFMAVEYWLSLVPIIPLVKKVFADLCCSILPNLFEQFRTRVVPDTPAPGAGNQFAADNRISANTTRRGVNTVKRTDPGTVWREQTRALGLFGRLTSDTVTDVIAPAGPRTAGVSKQAFLDANLSDAQRELAQNQITVSRVETYDPRKADLYRQTYNQTPTRLPPGSEVVVYQRDGRVAFYAVEQKAGVAIDPTVESKIAELEQRKVAIADVSGTEAQLGELQQTKEFMESQVQMLESQVQKLQEERTTEEDRVAALSSQQASLKSELAELDSGLKSLSEGHQALRLEIAKDRPVREVEGITDEHNDALREAGIRTVAELAGSQPAQLRQIGIARTDAQARALIASAQKRLN